MWRWVGWVVWVFFYCPSAYGGWVCGDPERPTAGPITPLAAALLRCRPLLLLFATRRPHPPSVLALSRTDQGCSARTCHALTCGQPACLFPDLCCPAAVPPLQVPDALLPDDVAAQLTAARQPQFVPIPGLPAEEQALALAGGAAGAQGPEPVDGHNPAAGVRQLRLSNGIKVNYRRTDNEPSSAMLRLVAMGGRAREGVGVGPSGNGVVAVGTRTLSESGTVGSWQREQVGAALCCAVLGCWRDRCGGHCTCGRAPASRSVDSSFLLFVLEPSHVLFLVLQQL